MGEVRTIKVEDETVHHSSPTITARGESQARNRNNPDHTSLTMANGVLSIGSWSYEGRPLEEPHHPPDQTDSLALSTWVVDQLRKSHFNDVRNLIEAGMVLQRLIEPKELRENGQKVAAKVALDRQQKLSALAAFLTVTQVNSSPCQQCKNRKSRGPCNTCVAGGPDYFNGACCNCQYSSTASACSFYKGKTKKRRRRSSSSSEDDQGRYRLTTEMLAEFSTREIERMMRMMEDEINSREAPCAPNKRSRSSRS
ncbi:hypothetical protein GGR54DRAFT_68806 [Hypoxylon sp. NC1633]|nr:hypothetical protein GGR54DRAFT_68806 [Hypoxylon sp. NC1633]